MSIGGVAPFAVDEFLQVHVRVVSSGILEIHTKLELFAGDDEVARLIKRSCGLAEKIIGVTPAFLRFSAILLNCIRLLDQVSHGTQATTGTQRRSVPRY